MLDIVHLAAQKARCQAFELIGGVGDVEAEGAMVGGMDSCVNRGPFGKLRAGSSTLLYRR